MDFCGVVGTSRIKKISSNENEEQRTQLDKNLAQTLQRILTQRCSRKHEAVIKLGGLQAVGESFQEFRQYYG